MKKIKEDIEFVYGLWKIKGEYYKETTKDGKLILKHVNKEEVQEKLTLVKKIATKLKDSLDTYKVLVESINKLPKKDLHKLHDLLFTSKRDYNCVTRSHHCVDMKVGNLIIPIVGD